MIRLVATDLDGTLLGPDGRMPAGNVDALRAAHAAGVQIAIATGRPVRWLDCLDPIAGLHPYVIASNGAVVYDLRERRVVLAHAFDAGQLAEVCALIRAAVPGVRFALERGDLFGVEPGTPSRLLDDPRTLVLPLNALIEHIPAPVKVLAYATEVTSDALGVRVMDAGDRATVTTSFTGIDFGLAELSVPGVTKGRALTELAGRLGIDAADAVAFGDMPNDASMLAWAGRGFVMADGHASLVEQFPTAGACADAGVGRVLLRLLDEA